MRHPPALRGFTYCRGAAQADYFKNNADGKNRPLIIYFDLRETMNKKHLIFTLALICCANCCFIATGCNNTKHTHIWKKEYDYTPESHWLVCEDCDEKKDMDAHVLSFPACTVCGYNFTPTEGVVYAISDDGTYATVVEYNGLDTTVVIASTYEGVPVAEIEEYAFAGGNKLTNVLIPAGIQTIGKFAFEGCSSLTNLVIPDSVCSMGENAFFNCDNLTELTLPFVGANIDSQENSFIGYLFGTTNPDEHPTYVPSTLKKVRVTRATFLGDYAFRYCTNLTEVIIPRTVTHIGYAAFYACDALKSIFIPNSVAMIKNYAFAYCYDITIYCEVESQPIDWDPTWNYGFPVVWGCKE